MVDWYATLFIPRSYRKTTNRGVVELTDKKIYKYYKDRLAWLYLAPLLDRIRESPKDRRMLREKLDIHRATLGRWLDGTFVPSDEDLVRIASALGVELDQLLGVPYSIETQTLAEIHTAIYLRSCCVPAEPKPKTELTLHSRRIMMDAWLNITFDEKSPGRDLQMAEYSKQSRVPVAYLDDLLSDWLYFVTEVSAVIGVDDEKEYDDGE